MDKNAIFYMQDILNCIDSVEKYTKRLSEEDFAKMEEKQTAVIWNKYNPSLGNNN